MKYSFSTRSKPSGGSIPLSTLEASEDVCCLLNGELRITYCNPAWDRFALANNGGVALSHHVVGSMIMDFVPSELIEFYSAVYAKARDAVVEFDYECSSPELYRSFQMQILPVEQPAGYTVINALRVEERMEGNVPHSHSAQSTLPMLELLLCAVTAEGVAELMPQISGIGYRRT